MKVTVIATGFPNSSGVRRGEMSRVESISAMTAIASENKTPPNNLRDFIKNERDERIDNEVSSENKKETREETPDNKKPKFVFNSDDESDDEDWGALPPFLMRKKR